MRMPTLKIKLIHQENGFSIYKDDYNYSVINYLGYILKSSKTIHPCLKFIREKKLEHIQSSFYCVNVCGEIFFEDKSYMKSSVENILNYKIK